MRAVSKGYLLSCTHSLSKRMRLFMATWLDVKNEVFSEARSLSVQTTIDYLLEIYNVKLSGIDKKLEQIDKSVAKSLASSLNQGRRKLSDSKTAPSSKRETYLFSAYESFTEAAENLDGTPKAEALMLAATCLVMMSNKKAAKASYQEAVDVLDETLKNLNKKKPSDSFWEEVAAGGNLVGIAGLLATALFPPAIYVSFLGLGTAFTGLMNNKGYVLLIGSTETLKKEAKSLLLACH